MLNECLLVQISYIGRRDTHKKRFIPSVKICLRLGSFKLLEINSLPLCAHKNTGLEKITSRFCSGENSATSMELWIKFSSLFIFFPWSLSLSTDTEFRFHINF